MIFKKPEKVGDWNVKRIYEVSHQSTSYIVSNDDDTERLARVYSATIAAGRKHGILLQQKLEHPHILKVIDHDFNCRKPYSVTEFARQGTIEDAIHEWSENDHTVYPFRELLPPIFEAVGWLHSQGITHNTLRKGHIFMCEGTLKLGAFRDAQIHNGTHFNTSKDISELARAYSRIMAEVKRVKDAKIGQQEQEEWQQKVDSLDLAPPKPLAAE